MKICPYCRRQHDRAQKRCTDCTTKAVAQNKRARQEARTAGLCATCRQPWSGETKSCTTCNEKSREVWANRKKPGHCRRCSGPAEDPKFKLCSFCRETSRAEERAKRAAAVVTGRCVSCGQDNDAERGRYCSGCILRAAAWRWLGDARRGGELAELFLAQSGRCAYSGEPLVLGVNASVDHRVPRSRGGPATLENLQWTTWNVNRAKSNLRHDEFVLMCSNVTAHLRTGDTQCVAAAHLYAGTAAQNAADLAISNSGSGSKTAWDDRLTMARRIEAGEAPAKVGAEFGVSGKTATAWWTRFVDRDRVPDHLIL